MLFHMFLAKLCDKTIENGVFPLNIATTTEYYNDSIVHSTAMHWKLYIYMT